MLAPIVRNIKSHLPLWPCILGLAIARASVVISSYGSYTSTDSGIFTYGSTLITITMMGLVFLVIAAKRMVLGYTFVRRLAIICIIAESFALFLLALSGYLDIRSFPVHMGATALAMIGATGAIYYWLRKARGTNTLTATIFVFSALIISEIIVLPFTIIPPNLGFCLAGALAISQLFWMRSGRGLMRSFTSDTSDLSTDFFGFAKTMHSGIRFMSIIALGLGGFAIVSGLLRGFPDGLPIPFTMQTRFLYSFIAIAICAAIILLVAKGVHWAMASGVWIAMQVTAYLSLILYALFPNTLEYGAVFATVLNVLIMGLNWYITIAFMSYGWRDPLYYAYGGWIVWFGGRALGRIVLLHTYPLTSNDLLMATVIGGILLISTQLTFLIFAQAKRENQDDGVQVEQPKDKLYPIEKLMGLDSNNGYTNIRQSAMEQSAKEMGRQFLLSERETEVLSLYALGFTQKRVAEELFITQGTAHGHIKRIYMKTGLHSRQQLIDYMAKYTL